MPEQGRLECWFNGRIDDISWRLQTISNGDYSPRIRNRLKLWKRQLDYYSHMPHTYCMNTHTLEKYLAIREELLDKLSLCYKDPAKWKAANPITVKENEITAILKTRQMNDMKAQTSKPPVGDICSVCFDTMDLNQMGKTACNHYFHFECLLETFRQSRVLKCPLCRQWTHKVYANLHLKRRYSLSTAIKPDDWQSVLMRDSIGSMRLVITDENKAV